MPDAPENGAGLAGSGNGFTGELVGTAVPDAPSICLTPFEWTYVVCPGSGPGGQSENGSPHIGHFDHSLGDSGKSRPWFDLIGFAPFNGFVIVSNLVF
jgi:hypothetical protein